MRYASHQSSEALSGQATRGTDLPSCKNMTFIRAGESAGVVAFGTCGLDRRLGRPKLSSHHDDHLSPRPSLAHRHTALSTFQLTLRRPDASHSTGQSDNANTTSSRAPAAKQHVTQSIAVPSARRRTSELTH